MDACTRYGHMGICMGMGTGMRTSRNISTRKDVGVSTDKGGHRYWHRRKKASMGADRGLGYRCKQRTTTI